ncbi:5-formyltetrahydrofolate cyclo-ligase [Lentibacillus sp. CBA3610]|uniref:5-formyltetrahydrofolate cyclo-ligase n=1 Tax=Lentibacillus sp. CBA3610 TaxID=2518176 RepID=UPI0015957352|nr:5-formyltetrahydrofolate cyclo-ligase [Lentibacillus sp. CBA3610]QKY69460.1 5-formyltetrahydrofolate cyclo-ligase [Lentibacillus sp. CBA3610]
MEKTELRKDIIHRLNNLSLSERDRIEQSLTEHLVTSDIWKQSEVIGITVSHGMEWNTRSIIEKAWQEGKTVCVPKCWPRERQLDFRIIDYFNQLESVYYNLWEPKPDETGKVMKNIIELLVVPGLLFDKNGYRIGFGGGYYDRFLIDFPNLKLSLAANRQIAEELPVEPFDIPVDEIITESGFIERGGS